MNGKIDGLPLQPGDTRATSASRRPAGNQKQAEPSNVAAGDTVSLTASARDIQHLEKTLAATPAVDQNRVDAIRKALADGSYKVDSGRVADRLMHADQALGKLES
jgi:negative regulator of flagellin synthesis FlgM